MSAIAAIFRRDRGPVSESQLAAMADRLTHRGPDGREIWIEGSHGLAHLHAWVTPEEVGERQPLRRGERVVAFDGRIDNRSELLAALGLERSEGPPTDAELVVAAHAAWGDEFCRRLVGPFALALVEIRSGRGMLARDALGDRSLFYADLGAELVVASEEIGVLAHPDVSSDLDESRLAHYFAAEVPDDGSTFFRGVTELRPGTLLRIGESSGGAESFWSPPLAVAAGPAAGDLAEQYRELLALAVESRLRSPGPAAILMSGGLDSTSVAALAAESAASRSSDRRPKAISWVFETTPACDERAFIHPVVERYRLEAHEVPADGLGPLPDGEELCLDPGGPEENPYRRLKSRAYARAASAGCTAVLSGGSADALYTGFEGWFVELLAEAGPWTAGGELIADLWRSGWWTGLRRAGLGRWWRRHEAERRPPRWLTPWAQRLLDSRAAPSSAGARRLAAAGPRAARGVSLETSHAARRGIDLRHPYRDRRLVEFMLSVPAYELYRNGRFKPIARRALAGRLPENVLTRTDPTHLTPLFDSAVRGSNREAWTRLLGAEGAAWPRFVRADWVRQALAGATRPAADVALWNCLSFELWRRRFYL